MSRPFACACGETLNTADAHAGLMARCPGCGAVLVVPGAPAESAPASLPPAALPPAAPAAPTPCPACAGPVLSGALRCRHCGAPLGTTLPPRPAEPMGTSRAAGAALLCGLFGALWSQIATAPLPVFAGSPLDLAGILLGLQGIRSVRASGGRKRGLWAAGAGILLSALALLKSAITLAVG